MLAFAAEWLNILIRWFHLVVGIGWIGTSFYFVALDLRLRQRPDMKEGVYGTAWLVHGGGFYNVEKYLVAPSSLPGDLVWYRWEAYLTFVSGFCLMTVQYYFNASAYLVDPAVLALPPQKAIAISVASLILGWLAYDLLLMRTPVARHTPTLAAGVFLLIVGAAWGFSHVFSGRGAFIHVGAMVGTIMAANVFMIIIPNQRKIAAALMAGRTPDPAWGLAGRRRSLHNNYLTLPVLLMMVSNHYPVLTGHPHGWLIVALILVVGGMARHALNRHEAGDAFERYRFAPIAAAVALVVAIVLTAPAGRGNSVGAVSDADVLKITSTHCIMCHSARPTHDGFASPPKDIVLTDIEHIRRFAPLINVQAVQTRVMPLGNETGITDEERAKLGAWIAAQ
jgi:uncharacterized membrane protein